MVKYPTGTMIRFKNKPRKVTKKNKFNAHGVEIDGQHFDSKVEGRYYQHLKDLKLDFKVHEEFEILPAFDLEHPHKHERNCKYTPDFTIYDNGKLKSAIDVKGASATLTTASRLRMKMFMYKYLTPVVIATYDRKNGVFREQIK